MGSALRAMCSFVSSDSQHPPMEGGIGQVRAVVDVLNTVWRREAGKSALRRSDYINLVQYWAMTNDQHKEGENVDWCSFFSLETEWGFVSLAYPDLCNYEQVQSRRRAWYTVPLGAGLMARARRNLTAVAVVGAEAYAWEYAMDLIESSVEQRHEVEGEDAAEGNTSPISSTAS